MLSSGFLDHLISAGAVVDSASKQVRHFGQPLEELNAASTSAVVIPLPKVCRIKISGTDRAKYLHNFCTNNVNDLQSGTFCEAFFGNVQARVLAHGFIMAGDDEHELWMLPGEEAAVLTHLNKFVITEDVTISSQASNQTYAVIGPEATALLTSVLGVTLQNGDWAAFDAGTVFTTTWNEAPTVFVNCSQDVDVEIWGKFVESGAVPAGMDAFQRLRIQERFPLVGVDIGEANLIPEADRDRRAISYTKGCYLGQEPIARIDAMGHVNRKLMALSVVQSDEGTQSASSGEDVDAVPLTSLSEIAGLPMIGLAVVSTKLLASLPLSLRTDDGRILAGKPLDSAGQ